MSGKPRSRTWTPIPWRVRVDGPLLKDFYGAGGGLRFGDSTPDGDGCERYSAEDFERGLYDFEVGGALGGVPPLRKGD